MNIFLDCGSNVGQGLTSFIEKIPITDKWKVYSWEPNPYCFEIVKEKFSKKNNFTFYPSAIWIENTNLIISIETPKDEGPTGQGSSVIPPSIWQPWNGTLNFDKMVNVPAIDFSLWLKNNIKEKDHVVCKMDIEGAEFDVLEKLIADESIFMIDLIYVEFHENHVAENLRAGYAARKDTIVEFFDKNKDKIELVIWH